MTSTLDKQADPRVAQILRWILAGNAEHSIAEAAEQTWPDTDTKPLIAAAMQELSRAGRPDPDMLRGFVVLTLQDIHRRATEANDLATSLAAIKQLQKLAQEASR
jgi:hypothetical protein